MVKRFKNWALRVTEPWREERAANDLAWRIFAQRHNAAGKRPLRWYPGMEEDGWELDPKEKVEMYEFPLGPDSKDQPIDPDYLVKIRTKEAINYHKSHVNFPKESTN